MRKTKKLSSLNYYTKVQKKVRSSDRFKKNNKKKKKTKKKRKKKKKIDRNREGIVNDAIITFFCKKLNKLQGGVHRHPNLSTAKRVSFFTTRCFDYIYKFYNKNEFFLLCFTV